MTYKGKHVPIWKACLCKHERKFKQIGSHGTTTNLLCKKNFYCLMKYMNLPILELYYCLIGEILLPY
jgi:hypothetical protein